MSANTHTYSITDLRQKTTQVLKDASSAGYGYVMHRSRPKAAIVDIDYLQMLQAAYEDYLDMLEYDKTINLPRIPLSQHIKKYDQKHS